MKLGLVFWGPALLALASIGCGSSNNPAGTDGAAEGAAAESGADGGSAEDVVSTGDAMGPDAPGPDAPVACNALVNGATAVTKTQVAMAPPTLLGGTVVDGTYFLTDYSIFTGPQGATGPMGTVQTTLQITGSTLQVVNSDSPPTRTVTLMTSGTGFTAKTSCPSGLGDILGTYTATATSFVVQLGGNADAGTPTVQETFTKQ
jgi:hypothetical protein